ncbi:MAG TPA: hypothetical protein VMB21_16695, partial [Candidatus Limnocylindria bacterium]|nr:hypothetical protein [Candidatus Limnocylindria bacterium]
MSRSRLSRIWLVFLLVLLPGCKGCNRGLGKGHETALRDGTVILLRGTNGYGAVILRHQLAAGETLGYEWFFR